MSNPFIEKANNRKAKQLEIANHNFHELQKLFFSFGKGENSEARERIRARLLEADEARKHYT